MIPLADLIRRMHISAGLNAGAYPTDVVASKEQIAAWGRDAERFSLRPGSPPVDGLMRVMNAAIHEGPPDTEVRILVPAREKV